MENLDLGNALDAVTTSPATVRAAPFAGFVYRWIYAWRAEVWVNRPWALDS